MALQREEALGSISTRPLGEQWGGRGRGRQRGCLSVDGRASEQVKFLEAPPLCTGSRFKGLGFTQHLDKWSFWKGGPVGVLPPASSWAPGHGVLGTVAVEAVCLLWHSLLQFLVHSATSLSLVPCCLVTSVPLAIQSLSGHPPLLGLLSVVLCSHHPPIHQAHHSAPYQTIIVPNY